MKLASDDQAGFSVPPPPALDRVIGRLARLSLNPEFALQREVAIARALKPYVEGEAGRALVPLPQEADLATLILYCDVYPEHGQLTLVEQLRDVITEHIPDEERVWLDPLKHSYLDLLEVAAWPPPGETLAVRSIGDGTPFLLPAGAFAKQWASGIVLLTRVVREPAAYDSGKAVWAGPGIVLSAADGQALLETTAEWRREMELSTGSFALGEWQEFTKRFGHMLLWAFAQLRTSALVDAVTHIRYRTSDGQPYLYAVALYDHHEYRFFADGLQEMREFVPDPSLPVSPSVKKPARRWLQQDTVDGGKQTVARLTLTSVQLTVECDSPERLNAVKHQLAAAFGFSLHFRGETVTPPAHPVSLSQLSTDRPVTLVVTAEEDQALLKTFLERAYLEWSDQAHQALGGQTPRRHAAASTAARETVAALIDDMERNDLGLRCTGRPAYDYNVLRGHVGLDEVRR